METDSVVGAWLRDFSTLNTQNSYRSAIKRYLTWTKKTGQELLDEAKSLSPDELNHKVFQFYQDLLTRKAQKTGSIKGRAGGTTGEYKDKTLSQLTCRFTSTVVQSFYGNHGIRVDLRRWKKKDTRMRRPRVERKKHQLTSGEITRLFTVAALRDKAILALGLMGQDEATISNLRTEQFDGKLGGEKLEIVELVRQKSNADLMLVLTPEVQNILKMYVATLKPGWMFPSYKTGHIKSRMANKIFKALCAKAGLNDNGRRLSFHCLRMWFSARLRNKIPDDLIDLMTGHVLRFNGAYIPNEPEELARSLNETGIIDLLKLQEETSQAQEIETLKRQVRNLETILASSLALASAQAGQRLTREQYEELKAHLKNARPIEEEWPKTELKKGKKSKEYQNIVDNTS